MSAVPGGGRLLSLDDWAALPEDNSRQYELVEGVLQVRPRPVSSHQRAIKRLCGQLDDQLPLELEALPEVEVVVADRPATTIRTPDIVVVPTSLVETEPARYRAEDVVLAVEVLSPGSSRTDKGAKFTEYAQAGIGGYWLVDLEPPVSLCAYQLIDGHYELDCETAEPVELLSPAPMTIDPGRLVVSRRTPPAE